MSSEQIGTRQEDEIYPEVGDRVYTRYPVDGEEWYWGVATKKFWVEDGNQMHLCYSASFVLNRS